ncbi:hypothetical protein OEG84_14790 [Hoeflea sp. G2-23]|uniref:Uncharacterized protein n=1 Tax=Hoeflea algicola TaxID=2983763 RepID=A0ABT3ZAW3_9HYPH|nr:hypothetical protein [Hoeflea algicola]MCY0148935.1 hypothetical protein [Hoeflea algicola]
MAIHQIDATAASPKAVRPGASGDVMIRPTKRITSIAITSRIGVEKFIINPSGNPAERASRRTVQIFLLQSYASFPNEALPSVRRPAAIPRAFLFKPFAACPVFHRMKRRSFLGFSALAALSLLTFLAGCWCCGIGDHQRRTSGGNL